MTPRSRLVMSVSLVMAVRLLPAQQKKPLADIPRLPKEWMVVRHHPMEPNTKFLPQVGGAGWYVRETDSQSKLHNPNATNPLWPGRSAYCPVARPG
jgi:hypothetical protein